MPEMIRVNTRIAIDINDWLDKQTELTGIPKSTQIHMALEQYVHQKEAIRRMGDMGQILEKLEQLERKLEK